MLLFSLKSALLLALLYVPYVLLLHRETFFRFNRVVLLAIMGLALTLPLVNVAPLSFDAVPAVSTVQTKLIDLGVPIESAPSAAASPVVQQQEAVSLWLLFTWVYALVAASLLAIRLWGFVRLRRIVRHSTIEHLQHDGLHIYIHAGDAAPFSWGRSIVIGQKDYEAHGREILLHETGHIRLRHSADIVLLTLCEMLQWFNPLVWMMGRSLTDLHEYEADAYVLRHDVDARTYQRLLLQRAAESSGLRLVQSFVGSLTRRRIKMMHTVSVAEAAGWRRLRALYVLPVLLLAAGIFATKEFREISAAVVEHDPTLAALSSFATAQDDEAAVVSAAVAQPAPAPAGAEPTPAPADETPAAPVDDGPASFVAQTIAVTPLVDTLPTVTPARISITKVHIPQAEPLHGTSPALQLPSVEVVASAESERMMDVGYGTMRKKLVSNHVNGYTGEELIKTGAHTLCEALARKVPGLSYVGGKMVYRAERVGLILVDGVQTSSPNDVNLHDIDYVEFDAEAFIYGSLGTHAVRVHTKR